MGLFSAVFGGGNAASVDTASYQAAINAFKSIATPELSALQVKLDQYVQAGKLSPEAAEAALLGSNAFNDIKLDPSLQGAQKQALQQLQDIASQGGLTATDKAQLNDIQTEQNITAKGRNEAILSNARERGIGGSGLELTSRLLNEQEAANRASTQGTQVAANAEQRALQSLQAAGQLGGQMEAAQYGQQANKAAAQNAIDRFNAETQNQTNLYNVGTRNQAEAANLAATQDIANKNTGITNQERLNNAAQVQQDYQNKLSKAQGIAGAYTAQGNAITQGQQQEAGASAGMLGGLLGTAGTVIGGIYGGPAGAAIGGAAGNMIGGGGSSKTGSSTFGGDNTVAPDDYWKKNSAMTYAEGGVVPGEPEVEGDSLKNDKVPALLSPGEIVVPRSAASDEEEYMKFMQEAKARPMACGGRVKMAQGGEVPLVPPMAPEMPQEEPIVPEQPEEDMIGKALKSLQFRVTNLEGGK